MMWDDVAVNVNVNTYNCDDVNTYNCDDVILIHYINIF